MSNCFGNNKITLKHIAPTISDKKSSFKSFLLNSLYFLFTYNLVMLGSRADAIEAEKKLGIDKSGII